ncbi:MAG: DNA recombination protein RmuC [Oscillospiraceae bacterium]
MEIVILVLLGIICVASLISMIIILRAQTHPRDDSVKQGIEAIKERTAVVRDSLLEMRGSSESSQRALRSELSGSVQRLGDSLRLEQGAAAKSTAEQLKVFEQRLGTIEQSNSQALRNILEAVSGQLKSFEERIGSMEKNNTAAINAMRDSVSAQMSQIRADNGKHLDEIRKTVDEKLQTSLEEKLNRSFRTVSDQLERVYKGLGEMQTLASGVGDLKKVLTNVKNRGILGEMQLDNILEEILAPEQYAKNVITIPDSRDPVEFAIKLPGDGDTPVYLPIDSKFPGDTYAAYRDACDSGDRAMADAAWKALEIRLKGCAKDISTKYVRPPYTTNFGIMFLPFEGLYAEAVNHGMVELLQREYSINIAGPSTMAAMLNSLYMGFRTLAIQKRSNEVWEILGAVRSEFEKFNEALAETQKQLRKADDSLEKLVGTRSRQMLRKLKNVETLDSAQSSAILELEE